MNIQNLDGLEKLSEMSESASTPSSMPRSQRNTQTSLVMPRTSVHEVILEECDITDESKSQMSVEVTRKSQSSQTESNKLYPV